MTSSRPPETAHGKRLAPVISMAGASLPNVRHWAGEGALRAPFEPPASRGPGGLAAERRARCPRSFSGDAPIADRRIVRASVRASAAEFAAWKAKASAAGVPLSDLLRQAMARTRTWTASAADVERERTRQIARIGNNLNQIARWTNTHADKADAVEVIAHLVAIEREIARLARFRDERSDARLSSSPAAPAQRRPQPTTCSASRTRPASSAKASRSAAATPTRSPPSPTYWSLSSTPPA